MATRKTATSGSGDVFQIQRIRQLIELMKEHDLSEVDLREADKRIRLRRGDDNPAPMMMAPAPAPVAASPPQTQPAAVAPTPDVDDPNIHIIKSPMVGTFYTKPKPESPAYVKVGDHVSPDTAICIIEAMKMFNEIQAEVTGQIVAVLVKNEEPVDVDKPLFKVDTSK